MTSTISGSEAAGATRKVLIVSAKTSERIESKPKETAPISSTRCLKVKRAGELFFDVLKLLITSAKRGGE
jgi:hypothetical protein